METKSNPEWLKEIVFQLREDLENEFVESLRGRYQRKSPVFNWQPKDQEND